MSPLASRLLLLVPNKNLNPELENQQLSTFCYLKIIHFKLWRAVNIKSRKLEVFAGAARRAGPDSMLILCE